jgi:hypothetical protein
MEKEALCSLGSTSSHENGREGLSSEEESYGNLITILVSHNPQAFLDLVREDPNTPTRYPTGHRPTDKDSKTGTAFSHEYRYVRMYLEKLTFFYEQDDLRLYPDAAIEVQRENWKALVNLMFLTHKEEHVGGKVALYCGSLHYTTELPVLSHAVYLLKQDEIEEPPFRIPGIPGLTPGGGDTLWLDYHAMKLFERKPEDLLQIRQVEVLPLLPLTQGGAKREVVEMMFTRLGNKWDYDLAYFGFIFATLICDNLGQQDDLRWLEERFKDMEDALHDSPAYQWVFNKGINEGISQGVLAMQQTAISIVAARFADLEELSQSKVPALGDLEDLQELIKNLSALSPDDRGKAKQMLLAIPDEDTADAA